MTDQYVTISAAGEELYCVQKADGLRYASMTSFTKIAGKAANSMSDFLKGNSPEAAPYKGLAMSEMKSPRGNKPMSGVLFPWGIAYLTYQGRIGNVKAATFVQALAIESLDVRVDGALGIKLTLEQVEKRTILVREKLIAEYIQGYQRIQEIKETMTTFSTPELDSIREHRNNIFFGQMTVLEKEVAKELQMDIDYPGWRNDEDPATLVTNRQGQVEVNPDQAAWYQRQQQDVLDKLAQRLQG